MKLIFWLLWQFLVYYGVDLGRQIGVSGIVQWSPSFSVAPSFHLLFQLRPSAKRTPKRPRTKPPAKVCSVFNNHSFENLATFATI